MFDKLQQLGRPHIPNFDQANKEQAFSCIRDRTGRFLTQDVFVLYVETEEEIEKPKYKLTGDAKEALQEYYDVVDLLCEAQTNFTKSTQLLEQKIERVQGQRDLVTKRESILIFLSTLFYK